MQRRLKKLVDSEYVLRLRALPVPRYGQSPHVFTLHRYGRRYLRSLGVSVSAYFRPSEERRAAENSPFMIHRLAAVDVLLAVDSLCRDYDVICPQLWTERELRRAPVKIELGRGEGIRHVAVIPDGWFQLSVGTHSAVSIALELDRCTEDQKAWRQKVAAYAVWAQGPYREAFDTDNLTVAVVTVTKTRREQLRDWTLRELLKRKAPELADIFLITAASPVRTPANEFFFGRQWYLPDQAHPVSLLEQPVAADREVFYRSV
jgi:hypothetical protein